MIRYDLHCSHAHAFDGWFQNSAGFDRLAAAGLVECSVCGDTVVAKRLMAPAVLKAGGVKGRPEVAAPTLEPDGAPSPGLPASLPAPRPPSPPAAIAGRLPPQMIAMLQRMRAEVEARCDYVGPDFAAEARRIHRGESERDGIYGEATEAEAEALEDEGIAVGRIPWVPRADG